MVGPAGYQHLTTSNSAASVELTVAASLKEEQWNWLGMDTLVRTIGAGTLEGKMRALQTPMVLEATLVVLEAEEDQEKDLDQEWNTVTGGILASKGLGVSWCSIF